MSEPFDVDDIAYWRRQVAERDVDADFKWGDRDVMRLTERWLATVEAATDEYKEATDAAMNYGQGHADAQFEAAQAAFIAATRHLDRLRVERGLEHLSAKDLAAGLNDRNENGEEGQAKGESKGDPTHGATPSEYQRFYDFVVQADPAIVDAWHFTENNKPGGLAEQVRNSLAREKKP